MVELILYVELTVETWSCWIGCGNTGDTLEIRVGMKIEVLSLDLLFPLLWK